MSNFILTTEDQAINADLVSYIRRWKTRDKRDWIIKICIDGESDDYHFSTKRECDAVWNAFLHHEAKGE